MESPKRNEELARTLAAWRLAPRRNPEFRAAVRARIDALPAATSWRGYARVHAAALAGALAVALVAGALAGREQARSRVAADRAEIAQAYVQALDARAMTMP